MQSLHPGPGVTHQRTRPFEHEGKLRTLQRPPGSPHYHVVTSSWPLIQMLLASRGQCPGAGAIGRSVPSRENEGEDAVNTRLAAALVAMALTATALLMLATTASAAGAGTKGKSKRTTV